MNKLYVLISFAALFLVSCDGKKKEASSEVETLDEEVKNEDIVEEDEKLVEDVLLENEFIKAIHVQLEPGGELPWHKGKERVMYPLNDFQLDFKNLDEDKEAVEKLFQKDVPNWYQEEVHSVKNTGNDTAKYLIVMRKQENFPEGELYEESELKEAEELEEVLLLDNPSIRVSRAKLESGEKTSMHKGVYRLAYALSDYSVSYDKENHNPEIRNIFKGDAHWHTPSNHAIENVSNKGIADFVLFEFKN